MRRPLTVKCPWVTSDARLRTAGREAQSEDDVVQPGFQNLKQVQTGQAAAPKGGLVVATELALENAIDAARLLLGAQLAGEVRFAGAAGSAAAAGRLAVLPGGEAALLERALGREAALTLQVELLAFTSAQFANWTECLCHIFTSSFNYTRRFLGGRQPL